MTTDVIIVNDVTIRFEPFKYVLMHKPKNTITTTSDEKGRKTVMDVIESEIGERVYPVGRLDRNTTGVLLLTNDGDLANRLMHPSYTVNKVYQAELNRIITEDDVRQLESGIQLEDGPAKAYHVQIGTLDPRSVQLTVHEGRNHLVRRMFEALGAEVITLKRSEFAGLVLGDIRPGRWRFLKMKEVNTLRTRVKLPELNINDRMS
jgi:23S rRNA pseudouridine2605 synthase